MGFNYDCRRAVTRSDCTHVSRKRCLSIRMKMAFWFFDREQTLASTLVCQRCRHEYWKYLDHAFAGVNEIDSKS